MTPDVVLPADSFLQLVPAGVPVDWVIGALAVGLLLVHFLPVWLPLDVLDRYSDRWTALGSGVAVTYVFVDVLPELNEAATLALEDGTGFLALIGSHIYGVALCGFLATHLVESVTHSRSATNHELESSLFRNQVLLTGAVNAVVGFMLTYLHVFFHPEHYSLFFVAIAVHFFVTDHGLMRESPTRYRRYGRWVLAGALALGVLIGVLSYGFRTLADIDTAIVFAVLAGAIIHNTFFHELQSPAESRSVLFVAAAVVYALFLFLV